MSIKLKLKKHLFPRNMFEEAPCPKSIAMLRLANRRFGLVVLAFSGCFNEILLHTDTFFFFFFFFWGGGIIPFGDNRAKRRTLLVFQGTTGKHGQSK